MPMEFKTKEAVNVIKCCRNKAQCCESETEKKAVVTLDSSVPGMQRKEQMNYHLHNERSQGD